MPTYRITDPTSGKTLKLTGDSPPTEQELNDIFGSQPKSKSSIESNPVYRAASKAQEIRRGNTKFEDVKENLIGAGKTTLEQAKNIVNSGLFGIPGRINKNLAPQGLNKGEEIAGSFLGGEVIGTPIINAGLKGIQKAYNLPGVKESKAVEYAVSKYKSIFKPKLIAETGKQIKLSDDKISSGLVAIHKNKKNLNIGDISGKLPENLDEGIAAAAQTKEKLLQEYMGARKEAELSGMGGFAGEGMTVDMNKIADDLSKSVDNLSTNIANPERVAHAKAEAERLRKYGKIGLEDAENVVKDYNEILNPFYGKPVSKKDAGLLGVDAKAASLIREEIDGIITSATGKQYQSIKNQYGAVVEVERNFVNSLNKLSKTSKIPSAASFDTVPILYGAFTGNVPLIASGFTQRGLKILTNRLKDPNLAVKSIFKTLDRSSAPTKLQALINKPLKGTAITSIRKLGKEKEE